MEREVLFTGVGGQGVQIVSKALAMAAVAEGREVQLVPSYSGAMRGGRTNAELSVSDGPLRALPIMETAWSAFVMDSSFWHSILPNLAPGVVLVVNGTQFHVEVDVPGAQLFSVPATDLAAELGAPMSAGFLLLGAYAAITGLVRVESVVDAMRELVPSYRAQHVAANQRAIEAGAAAVPALAAPAWSDMAVVR